YSFQKSHSILKGLEGDDVHQVGGRDSVLGDEDRRPVFRQFSENRAGFPLQGCNQLGFHKSDIKVSLWFLQTQTASASNVSPPERLPHKLLVERLRSREASAARPRTIKLRTGRKLVPSGKSHTHSRRQARTAGAKRKRSVEKRRSGTARTG